MVASSSRRADARQPPAAGAGHPRTALAGRRRTHHLPARGSGPSAERGRDPTPGTGRLTGVSGGRPECQHFDRMPEITILLEGIPALPTFPVVQLLYLYHSASCHASAQLRAERILQKKASLASCAHLSWK